MPQGILATAETKVGSVRYQPARSRSGLLQTIPAGSGRRVFWTEHQSPCW